MEPASAVCEQLSLLDTYTSSRPHAGYHAAEELWLIPQGLCMRLTQRNAGPAGPRRAMPATRCCRQAEHGCAGLLDAGGRNVTVGLRSASGFFRRTSCVGVMLFLQYWYWYPLSYCLSLALQPSALIGLNADLKLPKMQVCFRHPFLLPNVGRRCTGVGDLGSLLMPCWGVKLLVKSSNAVHPCLPVAG